jgi:hypothetical protein
MPGNEKPGASIGPMAISFTGSPPASELLPSLEPVFELELEFELELLEPPPQAARNTAAATRVMASATCRLLTSFSS